MELWEAMKELGENPNKVFKNRYGVKLTAKNGWASIDGRTTFPMEDVWEEVKQPVPWQEAIQAWVDGKKVSYSYMGYDKRFLFENSNIMMSVERIKNAEWYVED